MEKTVDFRDFEERDIDFIYKCKNDKNLSKLTVGEYRPLSYEEATNWVHGCMGVHSSYKYWAICTSDDEKRIVGWVSLSDINYENKSAVYHGIVIGDKQYRDGFAWIETYLFIYDYVFETLRFDYLYGSAMENQISTLTIRKVMFHKEILNKKAEICRNGKYFDVSTSVLPSYVYFEHKERGDYNMVSVLKRIRLILKDKK